MTVSWNGAPRFFLTGRISGKKMPVLHDRQQKTLSTVSTTDFLPGDTDPFGERSAMNKEPRTMPVADAAAASRAPENTPAMVKKIGKTTYKLSLIHIYIKAAVPYALNKGVTTTR